ncbi:RNase adapter RapZ [Pseudidiomarina terrestris]|uniref:RNase adapter RapZ n=1 Tax=Pseudidiomarina terrestris TaxID=2820060 RepID=A0AAW7QZZ1_9GAMM|nr:MULTISPECIES: RNase adapter RapZ [unclassified Pseudidiomarina]MDN7124292.1 RNase adapter RapZ [Pseudidiomarina sp. 1APP75-32.1]MDN7126293.1 RNase adapter RapZ [Pseudidiomarina sp. 1APR75-33.1]MDN7129417.1 RNase adapter RapZ [Pseudidiomarina sp. 1APR75-15]MDN7134318.1 RNase adapter RapZ [Pseudidiomarina sp. 1ASP75-5]MDN7136994.1 RNase adapter RapZ [Pseudidiomarina sp. 1ASP75-14]
MQLIIVTGRSGSGKTIALRVLEDLGYYCVDNLPIMLLPTLVHAIQEQYANVAVSVDVRNLPGSHDDLSDALDFLPDNIKPEILYLDSNDQVLLRRFGETRRLHPLSRNEMPLSEALQTESKLLEPLAERATWRIESSDLSVHQLSEQVSERVLGRAASRLIVVFQSFGFKYGLPPDLDYAFDTRILPNPHWEPELKPLTGNDPAVQHFFAQQPLVTKFVHQVETFLATWLPYFQRSNRSYLTIGIGCTGGQHRSVYIAEQLAERFADHEFKVQVRHREGFRRQ